MPYYLVTLSNLNSTTRIDKTGTIKKLFYFNESFLIKVLASYRYKIDHNKIDLTN